MNFCHWRLIWHCSYRTGTIKINVSLFTATGADMNVQAGNTSSSTSQFSLVVLLKDLMKPSVYFATNWSFSSHLLKSPLLHSWLTDGDCTVWSNRWHKNSRWNLSISSRANVFSSGLPDNLLRLHTLSRIFINILVQLVQARRIPSRDSSKHCGEE